MVVVEYKESPLDKRALFCFGINQLLESVVETEGEGVQVSVDGLGIHVGAKAPVVSTTAIVGVEVGIEGEQVDIEVEGDVVGKAVVQAGNHIDAEGGEVVAKVAGGIGYAVVGVRLETEGEVELCLAEDGEVLPGSEVVAEVGGKLQSATGVRGVVVLVADVVSVVVHDVTELHTNLHVVIQPVTHLGHDADGGVGSTADIVVEVVVVVVDTNVATDHPLGAGGHSKCYESKGHKDFLHNLIFFWLNIFSCRLTMQKY